MILDFKINLFFLKMMVITYLDFMIEKLIYKVNIKNKIFILMEKILIIK